MPLDYPHALNFVSSLQSKGWRLGLDRMQEFLRRAGLEKSLGQNVTPKYIHIAGTNGKGSTTYFVQRLLLEQGFSVGATVSPFVYDVRERIQFGRASDKSQLVSRSEFAKLVETLLPIAEALEDTEFGGPTEFEFKTAMGFLHWANSKADFVALEVGLGGRLDATNVVDPACSVITSIGLDHTAILGETHAAIAIEKAGIIKPYKPVVIGMVPQEARDAIETIAKVNAAPTWSYGREVILSPGFDGYRVTTPLGSYERLNPGLIGVNQPHNMALALAATELAGGLVDPQKVSRGVSLASAPGRMQSVRYQQTNFLLDGAHNLEAAHALVQSLPQKEPIVLLTGMLEGHAPSPFYEVFAKVCDEVHFVPIDFHRARNPTDLECECGYLFARSYTHETLESGLLSCLSSSPALILVTGSFYLVGELGRLIGAAPATD